MKFMVVVILMSVYGLSAVAKTANDCHNELKTKCVDKKGRDKFECMKNGVESLDEECKKMISAGREKLKAGAKDHPCMADREKCKDSGGHDKIMKCLLEKRAELSDACKKHLDDKMVNKPCFEDRVKFCQDVQPGEGRIMKCLKENNDKLSVACKEKMTKGKPEDFDKED